MKKILSLLMAAMLLPMALGAQLLAPQGESYGQLGGPSRIDLPANQKIMGHYDSDAFSTLGWRQQGRTGVIPIATDITPSELAMFQGGRILAFRVALAQSTPVTRVFVIPVTPEGTVEATTAWSCNVQNVGWNTIELETPYEINLPAGYSLRIGFDYKQTGSNYPISAVAEGDIYDTYFYTTKWYTTKLKDTGNLSVQCIVESDHFPEYDIAASSLVVPRSVRIGDDISFSFKVRNRGTASVAAGALAYDVAIDGNHVATLTNATPFGQTFVTLTGSVPTTDLEVGTHTLTVTTSTVNGEAVLYSNTLTDEFVAIGEGFVRQMRLVEQFTSTSCTYCPSGTAALKALSDMRGDIAWVAIHCLQNSNYPDPFRTSQGDSITSREGCDGFPEGSFDRSAGYTSASAICVVLTSNNAQTSARQHNSFLDYIETPAWAKVNINSRFDEETRQAVVTVEGDIAPEFDVVMGDNARLTVYITEDNLVASQYNNGTWVNDYVHNGVFRKALGTALGVRLNRTGDHYKNEFTVDIPNTWKAENLNVLAFISHAPLGNALTEIWVNNANKRKLGEYDEPAFIPGDLDGNGTVNISDVTLLIQYLLAGSADDINLDAADFNADGAVNVTDATEIIQMLLTN